MDTTTKTTLEPFEHERDNPTTLSFIISYALLPPVTRVLILVANS
jgi:hypothetical protein